VNFSLLLEIEGKPRAPRGMPKVLHATEERKRTCIDIATTNRQLGHVVGEWITALDNATHSNASALELVCREAAQLIVRIARSTMGVTGSGRPGRTPQLRASRVVFGASRTCERVLRRRRHGKLK